MLLKIFFFLGILSYLSQVEGRDAVNLSHPTLLVVDTDADIDDMVAILYLLKSPRIDIKAITTVGCGMTHWERGTKNISNLLELAGEPRIPVALGARTSLSPTAHFPEKWRTEADEMRGIKLPNNPVHPVEMPASKYIADLVNKNPLKMTILSVGPLTNIATALNESPEIKDKIEHIYITGGAILASGNVEGRPEGFRNQVAEYNIFLDGKAASDVFNSEVPITLIPLDLSEQVPITEGFYQRISETKNRKTPAANFVYEVIKPYLASQKKPRSHFWSPLAAMIITHPEIASYRDLKLRVNLKKGPEYGRLMIAKVGPSIRVVTGVDSKAFYDIFLEILNRPSHLK